MIVINPGSGPVKNATETNAVDNMKHFVADCRVEGLNVLRNPKDDEDGRYSFLVWKGTRCHKVEMPGLPLSRVRYMSEDGQNIWDFPRLYVNDSSWIWQYALLGENDFKEDDGEDWPG